MLYNYFGLGNRTENESRGESNRGVIRDYRIRFSRFFVSPTFERDIFGFVKLGAGPQYDQFRIDQASVGPKISSDPNIRPSDYELNRYAGARAFMNLGTQTSAANPRLGIHLNTEYSAFWQLNNEGLSYRRLASELIFYVSPNLPFQLTLAGRLGGAHNFGDYRFWQANTLGTTTNLRGYRRTRFAGRSSVYANSEVRLELFRFNAYLFPGSFGIMGLFDAGRVYTSKDRGGVRDLHTAYGGGVWVDILKRAVITGTVAHGEETLGLVQFSFLF